MSRKTRPNVLWLMSDQHNASCLGHAGRNVRTPNLDALAERGVSFSQAFCNNPICGPSRTTFITGQYPHTHRHLGNDLYHFEQKNSKTISAIARQAGYQTALIGKGHMVHEWTVEGFEHIRYCDLCDADRNDPLTTHYFRYLVENGLADAYDLGTLPPDHPGKKTQTFVSEIPHEHSIEVWTGNETVNFLKTRDRDRPFFIQMSFERPHAPLSPSPERADMYAPENVDIPSSARDLFEREFKTKPDYQKRHVEGRGAYPVVPEYESSLRTQIAHYYALVTIIDEQIGRVIDCLKSFGDLEDTVVVYVADHGDFAGDHGLMQKNMGIYESIHRIPFILWYPECPAGQTVTELVESVDLYPTLCELMGISLPDRIEGQSLLPVIEKGAPGKDAVICEWDWRGGMVHGIRTRTHRMVYYGRDKEGELYDRDVDPDEVENLYSDPNYQEVKLLLLEQITDHIMKYERRTGSTADPESVPNSVNTLTNLIHKQAKKWSEIEPFYQARRS